MVRKMLFSVSMVLLAGIGPTQAAEPGVAAQQRPGSAYPQDIRHQRISSAGKTKSFDRRRAAKTLSEISQHVDKMANWARRPAAEFNAARAEKTLQVISAHVAGMQKRAQPQQRTVAGPAEDMHIRHYNRQRIPTPMRVANQSGMTHQQLAEQRLRQKGYRKTSAGWVPPNFQGEISQRRPTRSTRVRVSEAVKPDPF